MQNFAQELPILIFLPFLIFTAVSVIAATVHFMVVLNAKAKSRPVALAASGPKPSFATAGSGLANAFNIRSAAI